MKKINKKNWNKKGFIRIVEAIFAILLITGAMLFFFTQNTNRSDISEEIYEKQRYILDIIANNESMRHQIISGDATLANTFINKNIPSSWKFSTCIANIDETCNNAESENGNIYVSESIISSSPNNYPATGSKKLRFFVWLD